MRSRMIDFSSLSKASWTAARRCLAATSCSSAAPSGAAGAYCSSIASSTALVGVLALELVLDLRGRRRAPRRARRGSRSSSASSTRDRLELFLLLADLLGQLALQRAQLLDLGVGDVERVEDLGLGDLVGAGLDHQDRVLGAGDDQVEVRGSSASRRAGPPRSGLTTKLPSTLPMRTAPTGRRQRDVGDHQRRRGAVHREDVVGVDVVDRQRDRHELRVVAPALGEQRADRAVDHARRQRRPSRRGGPRA